MTSPDTWRRRRASGLVAAVATAGLLSTPAGDAAAHHAAWLESEPTAGAPGIGDAYFPTDGNGGYQAVHYGATISVSRSGASIVGRAAMEARATQALSRFDLDLSGLTVDSVAVDGHRAHWARRGDLTLVITPIAPLADGQVFHTVVRYHGRPGIITTPDGFQNGWFATTDGATAVGQPPSVQVWMPVNEHPADKATYDLRVSVAPGRAAISNGRLLWHTTRPSGRSIWRWHSPAPTASYLMFLSVGRFDLTTRTTAQGIHLLDALDPTVAAAAAPALAREPEVLRVLARSFGPYPFSQAGGVVDDLNVGYALETQTRPFYSAQFFSGSADADTWVVAHELAHQWYGDSVSLRRWRDIWLNEGFATYAEWMWAQHQGTATPAGIKADILANIPADDSFWAVDISDPGVMDLFSDPVYVRGALVLQTLREDVGSSTFFEILRAWAREHRHGHGTTGQFVALAEQMSQHDLTALFDTWLYGAGKPESTGRTSGRSETVRSRQLVDQVLRHARLVSRAAGTQPPE